MDCDWRELAKLSDQEWDIVYRQEEEEARAKGASKSEIRDILLRLQDLRKRVRVYSRRR